MTPSLDEIRIIDVETRVSEPEDLWTSRVSTKRWGDLVPHVRHDDERGIDVWWWAGEPSLPSGLMSAAGWPEYTPAHPPTLADGDPGAFDPHARLKRMDEDGIHAHVLYPNLGGFGSGRFIALREPELQLACVRAYNEWLLEFCEGSGGRLIGQAVLPTTGVDDATSELDWALEHGHKGGILSSFPNGTLNPKPEDDRFWAQVEERGTPIAIHIGSFLRGGQGGSTGREWTSLAFVGRAAWTKAGGQTLDVVCDVLFSGIFERFPGLKIVLVEANIGWIPTLLEQSDDMFRRYRWYTGAVKEMTEMPSRVFFRNFWATFMVDSVGVELRHRMNLDHIMWSTDYPHSGSDWPESRISLERVFRGVPRAEVRKMLHDNCKALYGLDHIPDVL